LVVSEWQAEKDNFESRIRELEEENSRLKLDNASVISILSQLQQEVGELREVVEKISE